MLTFDKYVIYVPKKINQNIHQFTQKVILWSSCLKNPSRFLKSLKISLSPNLATYYIYPIYNLILFLV